MADPLVGTWLWQLRRVKCMLSSKAVDDEAEIVPWCGAESKSIRYVVNLHMSEVDMGAAHQLLPAANGIGKAQGERQS